MAHDPHGKQARLNRIARIRSAKTLSVAVAVEEQVNVIATHPHFEGKHARREVLLVEKYEKLLHPDWHDDAYL